ncbi:MAG: hypothetical protein HY447_02260 [Candidatus Omnitrophica bacterium]|nr:hypothetical protein [Candidatus Omnitrophota bacterium]
MKHVIRITLGIFLIAATAFIGKLASAQDPLELAPDIYTLLFENERVRVADVSFQPGEKIAMHSHPDHFVYVLSPSKLRLGYADGTSKDIDTEFHALVVELKE